MINLTGINLPVMNNVYAINVHITSWLLSVDSSLYITSTVANGVWCQFLMMDMQF
jgi:hypothetical protein